MTHATFDKNGNITGIFNRPQIDKPHTFRKVPVKRDGKRVGTAQVCNNDATYSSVEISDDDPRAVAFLAAPLLRRQAQALLELGDRVATRCVKAGIAYPDDWRAFDAVLRLIAISGAGDIPTQPPFPEGT